MDTEQLRAFLQVSAQRSFTEAARSLGLTQPAVSKRISALEQELGSQLFHRIGHRVELSSSGQVLLEQAQHIIQSIDTCRHRMQTLQAGPAGPVRLSTSHHVALHRLPAVLQRLIQQYPAIDVTLDFVNSETAFEGICKGQLEVALVTLPPAMPKQVRAYPLWQDELVFVCSGGSPLADKPEVTLADLAQSVAVLPAENTFTRQRIDECFHRAELALEQVKSGGYLETIKMLVKAGMGWGVLPHVMLDDELVQLTPAHSPMIRSLGLLHNEQRPLSKAAVVLLELIQNEF